MGQIRREAVGYCIARYAVPYKYSTKVDTSKVHVESLAIAPRHQGKGYAALALLELLSRTEDRNVRSLDFYLRDSTSYPAIMANRSHLEAYGFNVSELPSADGSIPRLDNGELLHHVMLHKDPLVSDTDKLVQGHATSA